MGASRNLEPRRAPLPVPGVRSRVAPRSEPSDLAARQALACCGALGAGGRGRSSFDGGVHRPVPRRIPKFCQHGCPVRWDAPAE